MLERIETAAARSFRGAWASGPTANPVAEAAAENLLRAPLTGAASGRVCARTGRAAAAVGGASSSSRCSFAASARAARPRWLIASFSSGLSSAMVRSSPG